MDSLIAASARALAAGDALGALKHVALREDPPALALRGIAMAQLGEHPRARELLRRAARGFGAHEAVFRARCVVAEAEVALALRDVGGSPRALLAAATTLEAHADHANAQHARLIALRRLLLLGRLGEAATALAAIDADQGMPPSLAALAELGADLQVRHQAGRTLDEARAAYAAAGVAGELSAFIDDMAEALAWADLLVCRAGALTLAEIAAVGVPGLLVPLPHAIDDHQTRNAEYLVAAGAAILMPERTLSAATLATQIRDLLRAPERLAQMAEAARRCARPDATQDIAAICRPFLKEAA